jgi:hypothetical protein
MDLWANLFRGRAYRSFCSYDSFLRGKKKILKSIRWPGPAIPVSERGRHSYGKVYGLRRIIAEDNIRAIHYNECRVYATFIRHFGSLDSSERWAVLGLRTSESLGAW